jgi:hypothetical protein
MYNSNHFNKNNMLEWEKQPNATKTNYNSTKDYFEASVKVTDTYEQNAGGRTAGRNKYESANQLADYDDKIREYIAKIPSASASAANANATTKPLQSNGHADQSTHQHSHTACRDEGERQPKCRRRRWRRQLREPTPTNKKGMEHGGLLSLPWLSPNWRQP